LDFDIGVACGQCATLNPLNVADCRACGHALGLHGPVDSGDAAVPASEDEAMEQARNYVCRECSTPVPSGHKFCGTCGATVPVEVVELRTKFFGAMQTPGKARLILIRGDAGVDGLSYMLQGTEHVAGRDDGQILFPEDVWLSPRHANFVYEDGNLVVRDEGSLNGVYVRVRERVELGYGDSFLCGEQLFMLEQAPEDTAGPAPDQTYFYSSPRKTYGFRVVQILTGGTRGIEHCAVGTSLKIGREDCDMNFPTDVYMSSAHAKLEAGSGGEVALVDLGSKNGCYVRVHGEQALQHGDYLFMGRQLLRVEITA
jgi:pSer/pThr/pTyr-binding forkhead associated (FHA) protein